MNILRTVWNRFFSDAGESQPAPSVLAAEVENAVNNRDTPFLQNWLQTLLRADSKSPAFQSLMQAVTQNDWPKHDIDKLEIFGLFYQGNLTAAFERASKYTTAPNFDPDLFIIAAFSLFHSGAFEEAYRVLALGSPYAALLDGRSDFAIVATLISQAANVPDALKRYIDLAWRLAPTDPAVALNAYAIYFELGDMPAFDAVRQAFRRGDYSLEQTGFALAVVELAQDHYEEGFRLFEERYKMTEAPRYLNSGLFALPRWQGEDLASKHLLISAEQGLGDTIQMARYLPELNRLGAAGVVMETQPETLTLLQHNFPHIQMVERKYGIAPALHFDLWVGAMSLPTLLGTSASTVPGQASYLHVPPEAAGYWRTRVTELARANRPKIGLAWSGQPTHRSDRRRSIPFAQMMQVVRACDASFFALQTHVPEIHPANLISISDEMVTLADTAALIAEMDWVITVDTSVVHLAGAIGKEAWLLLPYRYEWRWSLNGESNHWYDSVKVLRQQRLGDWDGVLADVFDRRLPQRRRQEKRQ